MNKGEFLQYINVIGLEEGDAGILNPIGIIGEDFVLEKINIEGFNNVYYKFIRSGVEFIFECGKLVSIIFYMMPLEGYKAYTFLPDLITGLKNQTTRFDVLNIFGEPFSFGGGDFGWLKYCENNKFIHFEFDSLGVVKKISLLEK